jgi:hypothetical protein
MVVQNEWDGMLRTWMIPSIATLRWLIHEATAGETPARIYHLPPLNSIVLEREQIERFQLVARQYEVKTQNEGGAGMLKFYADVHKAKKYSERNRITYTTDGTTFKHIDSLGEIPAGPGDQLLVDTIPQNHTDDVIELLRRDVEVHYLRRLSLLKKVRGEFRLPKSARGDIKALMNIEEGWFRRVTEDFLVLRRMILASRWVSER